MIEMIGFLCWIVVYVSCGVVSHYSIKENIFEFDNKKISIAIYALTPLLLIFVFTLFGLMGNMVFYKNLDNIKILIWNIGS